MSSSTNTSTISVRVIAKGGKFLADDIGGAAIVVRDYQTKEVIAKGVTRGDSGPNYDPRKSEDNGVMGSLRRRGEPIPMNADPCLTCNFTTSFELFAPRQIEVEAFGPLAARASAGVVTANVWIYPGIDLTAGNGLLLEMPGLICQITNPPTHTTTTVNKLIIATNVAMMCGCPISVKGENAVIKGSAAEQPWLPDDFEVHAHITQIISPPPKTPPPAIIVQLKWDGQTAGRFIADQTSLSELKADTYALRIAARQLSNGNLGRDLSTFILSG